MEIQEIREKLKSYIQVADEKKISALYTLLEDDVNEYTEWWNDEAFLNELDEEYTKSESGEVHAYTEEEANIIFQAEIDKYKNVHV